MNNLVKSGLDRSSFLKLGLSGAGIASLTACGGGGGIFLPRSSTSQSRSFTFEDLTMARSRIGLTTAIGSDGTVSLKNGTGKTLLSGSISNGAFNLNGKTVFSPPTVDQGKSDTWFSANEAVAKVRYNSTLRGVEAIASSPKIGNSVHYQGRSGSVLLGNTNLGGVIFDSTLMSKIATDATNKFRLSGVQPSPDAVFHDRVSAMKHNSVLNSGRLAQDEIQTIGHIIVYYNLQNSMSFGGGGGDAQILDYNSAVGQGGAPNGVAISQCIYDTIIAFAASLGIPSIIKMAQGQSMVVGEELLGSLLGASAADAIGSTVGIGLIALFGELAAWAMVVALLAAVGAAYVSCSAAF